MRQFWSIAMFLCTQVAVQAQPALVEPPEFPMTQSGPRAVLSGQGCFYLASGMIAPGDVDWVQVLIPRASTLTIVDVDFPVNGGFSAVLALAVGGTTGFNIGDSNSSRDAFCGLSATTNPVGSTRDSAVSLGATGRNTVIDIAVTGAEDTGFIGAHSRSFEYDLWVYAETVACTGDTDCDDGIACTEDRCDVATGGCSSNADDALCDNGRFCDGVEYCDPMRGCRSGPRPDCDDSVDCTIDDCDSVTDQCVSLPDDGFCDNGTFCDGGEWCDAVRACQPGDPPDCDDGVSCTVDQCDLDLDACVHDLVDALCDDGLFCTGVETCDALLDCQPGMPPDCDDGVSCTADECDPVMDACVHGVDHAFCDDGVFCNGVEACDPLNDCQPGTPPDCDDGVACTVDACDPRWDQCVRAPDDRACDNGVFCDGAEICDAVAGCVSGTDPCPRQFCRESDDQCVECLNDVDCDDGDFCNGAETCDADGSCSDGAPPCPPGMVCNPDARRCEGGAFALDVKPNTCPNRVMSSEQGYLTMAILGSPGADVRKINKSSIRVARVDDVGEAVAPNEGPPGPRSTVEDVGTPFDGPACGCNANAGDGQLDLALRFSVAAVRTGLRLDQAPPETPIELRIAGRLLDGTPFQATDCITIGGNGRRPNGQR
ncbi:MAG: hypothetical protein V1790_05015 [Planctomycetota bacterium]